MDVVTLSRLQFGDTSAFHILWPMMSIGFSFYMLVMESAWLYTKKEHYYRQLRFWTKIFVLTFAVGTASGIPLEFEFGTNWAAFSTSSGDFFGNILGFESTVAFALEAAFLAVLVFGWRRVPKAAHLFANAMVFLGATLSAFWIMAANSWMQVPVGITMQGSKIIVTDYAAAILNPDTIVSFGHMWVACVETTLFMMGGLCAWILLRNTAADDVRKFFLDAFKFSLALLFVLAPLQIVLGDISGQTIATYQPAKLAASELHWDTNTQGGAAWQIVAWPRPGGGGNSFALSIPDALSMLTTHSTQGRVVGLNDFAPGDRPSVVDDILVFYSFRVMVAIGFALFFLMALGAWYWRAGTLTLESIAQHRMFLKLWIFSIPLGFIATEAGWMVREIGRQPWVIYHLMRTSEGISSHLNASVVATTTAIFTSLYLVFGVLFIYFTYRTIAKGPDLTSPLP